MLTARRVAPILYAAIILATLFIFSGRVFGIVCIVGGVLLGGFYVVTQPKGAALDSDRARGRAARRAGRRGR